MLRICQQTKDFFKPLSQMLRPNDVLEIGMSPDDTHFLLDFYREDTELNRRNAIPIQHSWVFDIVNRLPEAKPNKSSSHNGKMYPVLATQTDVTCELIAGLIPSNNLKFTPDKPGAETSLARQIYMSLLGRSWAADEVAKMMAEYSVTKEAPKHDLEFSSELPLAPYQQAALCCQHASPGFGLFSEPGTGKTAIVIADICNSAKKQRAQQIAQGLPIVPYRVVIVVPNQLRSNWLSEFHRFATQGGRVSIIRGTQLDRVRQLYDGLYCHPEELLGCTFQIIIVGYKTFWRSMEAFSMVEWDLAVLDEAHEIKNIKTAQAKGCLKLRDHSNRRVVLTGTPIGNSAIDTYTLLEFMSKGNSGFSTFKAFKSFYGTYERTEHNHERLVRCVNLPFLQERMSRCSFFISLKEACPDLPDIVYDTIEVEMTPAQGQIYKRVCEELALEIEDIQSNSGMQRQMQVTCILTKLLRLAQITSGFVVWSPVISPEGEMLQPSYYEWCDATNPKIEAVAELLQTMEKNEKAIIWANWIPAIEYLCSMAESLGIKHVRFDGTVTNQTVRDQVVLQYNSDPETRLFIGTPASGGAGLNLIGYPPGEQDAYETNTTRELYFAQGWSQILRTQSEKRGYRRGTRRNVTCTDFIVPGSIDVQIQKAVMDKKQQLNDLADLDVIIKSINKINLNLDY